MTRFYRVQVGALETEEYRTTPVPFWLVAFSDTVKGPLRQMFFVVVLPDGKVVEPSVEAFVVVVRVAKSHRWGPLASVVAQSES
jgi:hypothetical protein